MAITVLETFPRAMAPFAVMTAESGIPWVVVETLAWDLAHPVGRCTAVAALTLTVLQYVDVCMYVRTYVRSYVLYGPGLWEDSVLSDNIIPE